MPKRYFKRKTKKYTKRKLKSKTLRYVVKKVRQLDKIDNCFKHFADQINVASIINKASTIEMNTGANGFVRDITNVDEDFDSTQSRLRQRIQPKYLSFKYNIRTALTSDCISIGRVAYRVRLLVVYQKSLPANINNLGTTNGAQYPLLENLLFTNSICSHMDLLAPQSWLNKSGFRILADRMHMLYPCWRDANDSIPNQQSLNMATGQINLNLSKLPMTEYGTNADGQFAVTKGRLMIIAFSDNALLNNAEPLIMDYNGIFKYDN